MSERVTASQAARLLDGADHILILTHQFPDGDTLAPASPSASPCGSWARPCGWPAPTPSRRNTST